MYDKKNDDLFLLFPLLEINARLMPRGFSVRLFVNTGPVTSLFWCASLKVYIFIENYRNNYYFGFEQQRPPQRMPNSCEKYSKHLFAFHFFFSSSDCIPLFWYFIAFFATKNDLISANRICG